jgi:hypothetical protein
MRNYKRANTGFGSITWCVIAPSLVTGTEQNDCRSCSHARHCRFINLTDIFSIKITVMFAVTYAETRFIYLIRQLWKSMLRTLLYIPGSKKYEISSFHIHVQPCDNKTNNVLHTHFGRVISVSLCCVPQTLIKQICREITTYLTRYDFFLRFITDKN